MVVIGIDIGTQSLKAIVVDGALTVRGEGSVAYQPVFPRPCWAEQDPRLWLGALRTAIGEALSRAGIAARDVTAVGITGQLDGCVPVDREGAALAPALIWMDRRATAEIAGIDPEWIRQRTGTVLDPTHMAAKIRWFMRNLTDPAAVATWHQPVSFVVAALCGRHVLDHGLASTTMLYDLRQRTWSDDFLEAFDIDATRLPEIADATSVAGHLSAAGADLTGLPAGTAVVVGTGDDFSGAIGAGVIAPGAVSCCVGTAEVVGAVSDGFRLDDAALVETHGFPGGRFFVENPGWLAGGAVSWFCHTFGIDAAAEMSEVAATARPGSDDLLFLPALSGAMAPRWEADARGAFYGLSAAHGRAECARAVLEGCAFAMRDVVDRLNAMGMNSSAIRLSGGGARSEVWSQVRADVSGLPVEIVANTNTAPLGAALLAMPAVGITGSLESAAQSLVKIARTVEPDIGRHRIYDRAYRRYRALFEALTEMFGK
jgi:xylulokinase